MNKSLMVLTVISLSLVAFLSGYLISQNDFHRSSGSNSSGNILDKFNEANSKSNSQENVSGVVMLLSKRNAVSPALSKEKDSTIYYEKDTGKVFEVALKNMRESSVSDIPLANLIKTVWAPNRKEVVSLFYHPSGNRYKYFSYKTRASVDFGVGIKSLAFSPDGSQVTYFENREGSRGIFISQPDSSSSKKILSSRLENANVYWPSNDLLAFQTDAVDGSELYSLSRTGEIKKLLGARNSLEIKWSKDGSKLIFSQKDRGQTDLFYKGISSETETPLGVSTSASKCNWSIDDKTIVCGVPRLSASGDEFYEISLDGTKKLLSSPTSRIDTAELFLSGLNDYVIILNSLDNKLYVLKK